MLLWATQSYINTALLAKLEQYWLFHDTLFCFCSSDLWSGISMHQLQFNHIDICFWWQWHTCLCCLGDTTVNYISSNHNNAALIRFFFYICLFSTNKYFMELWMCKKQKKLTICWPAVMLIMWHLSCVFFQEFKMNHGRKVKIKYCTHRKRATECTSSE